MPSSYSTNLLLELMADGENEGLWGDITNENLEILGRAAGGVGTISLAGTTHTLTVSQGQLSEGQYSTLVLGGSPTGTNTITINPNTVTRTFLVQNSSGQDAVFTQGSGGNVTVPNGGTAIVFCSGSGASSSVTDITAGFLRGVNNLSDLDDPDTALQNLGLTATAAEINKLDGATLDLAAVTATAAEVNVLDGSTATTGDLNKLADVTATAAELNVLDGATAQTFFPSGGIIMWSGTIANIPSGWALCDGTNGTPNLTGRFVVHADADSGGTYAPGDTGGADNVTLTEAQMPSHTHFFSGTTDAQGNHRHVILNQDAQGNFGGFVGSFLAKRNPSGGSENYNLNGTNTEPSVGNTSLAGNHAHNFNGNTGSAGSNTSHENRPPFYALAFIQKL